MKTKRQFVYPSSELDCVGVLVVLVTRVAISCTSCDPMLHPYDL